MHWSTAITINGTVYPIIKSIFLMGDAQSLDVSAVFLSLETIREAKSMVNEKEKAAIPGVRFSISYKVIPASSGMPLFITVISKSIAHGRPRENM